MINSELRMMKYVVDGLLAKPWDSLLNPPLGQFKAQSNSAVAKASQSRP